MRLGDTLKFLMVLPLHFWEIVPTKIWRINQNIEKESLCQPLIEVSLEIKQNLQENIAFDKRSIAICAIVKAQTNI